ncbi:MAG: hypothetical protein IPH03_19215, partial [Tetrasphaera sp.]|nr:hypothetical protein [Tetrasphaera sp.]
MPLPTGADGAVEQNPWAFYPVFPLLARLVMRVTGLDFYAAGSSLSLVLGALAMLALFRLVDEAVGRWSAIVAVVGTTTYLAAPVLQTSYTESAALLVVVLTLMALRARRYVLTLVALVVLALTRNIVLAMAPVMLAHFAIRWLRRDVERFPRRHQGVVLALAAASVALTWLWPTIVGRVTGDSDGYTRTMAAWRVIASEVKLHTWIDYLKYDYGYAGWAFAAVSVVVFVVSKCSPHRTQRWGPELWGWAGAYPAYQVLVTGIGPSRVRYALLAFPSPCSWGGFSTCGGGGVGEWVASLVGVGCRRVALQGWWIWNYWII